MGDVQAIASSRCQLPSMLPTVFPNSLEVGQHSHLHILQGWCVCDIWFELATHQSTHPLHTNACNMLPSTEWVLLLLRHGRLPYKVVHRPT